MARTLAIIQVFLSLHFNIASGNVAAIIQTTPGWAIVDDVSGIPLLPPSKVGEGYYYLLVSEQYNPVRKHDFYHYAIKVVSEAGLTSASQIEFRYDPSYQRPQVHFIRVHRDGKIIDRTFSAPFRILQGEDLRSQNVLSRSETFYCNLPDLRNGDIIEYGYSLKGYSAVTGDYFSFDLTLGYGIPIGRVRCCVITALQEQLAFSNKNTKQEPVLEYLKEFKRYTWIIDNPPLVRKEENTPDWFKRNPLVQVSNFSSWHDVKNWCNRLFKLPDYSHTELEHVAESFRINSTEVRDRITAAVDFVQKQVRYLSNSDGIYTHIPHTPDFVLANRYGDCKDKSMLLVELLRLLEVEAWPVLLNSTGRTVENDLPTMYRFDHCVVAIQSEGFLYYVDPTVSYQKGDYSERQISYFGSLMVLDDSDSLFRTVPAPVNQTEVDEVLEIDPATGDATITARFTFYGTGADDVRYYFATNSLDDVQSHYTDVYKSLAKRVELIDSVKVFDNYYDNRFITLEKYRLKGFWTSASQRTEKTSAVEIYPLYLNGRISYVKDTLREDPLRIKYPENVKQKIRLIHPSGWKITPTKFESENRFFSYLHEVSVHGNELLLDYRYHANTAIVEPENYRDYLAASDRVGENIVFSIQPNVAGGYLHGFNWLLTIVFLVTAAGCIYFYRRMYLKRQPVLFENRYDSIGGWLIVVGITLLIGPLVLGYSMFTLYEDEFDIDYFRFFFDRKSPYFSPARGVYALVMCAGNILLLGMSLLVLKLFFERRSAFRPYFIIYKVSNILLLGLDLVLIYLLYSGEEEQNTQIIQKQESTLIKSFLQAAIWVPYVYYSERSRHTFTRTSNDANAGENSEEIVPHSAEMQKRDNNPVG